MKMKRTITALMMASVAFSAAGFLMMPKMVANADGESKFYMEAGAGVNIDDESYGGIRWTTVVEEGYTPAQGVTMKDVSFGTFVVPTATYQEEAASTEIRYMTGVVDVVSNITGADVLEGDVTYYSAIKYDDIIADYKEANGLTELTEAQTTRLLKKAYAMELTAVSYALFEGKYYYAEAEETSRSARQVANMAILTKELESKNADEARIQQVNSYVKTGATSFERVQLDNANEGYLDLTELSATEVTAQPITVSSLTALDFSDSGNVAEVLIGAKKITGYTYADGTLSVSEGSACLEAGNETWLSVFTKNGNVYSLPIIPADGVIREAKDLDDTFGIKNTVAYSSSNPAAFDGVTVDGYYVLGNDITGDGKGGYYIMSTAYVNGGSPGTAKVVELGGFKGTFDGRGHTISKLKTQRGGIFGWMVDATIKNVAFTKMTVGTTKTSYNQVLATVAYNTTLDNVYVDMDFNSNGGNSVFGYARSSTFNNFILNVTTYKGQRSDTSAMTWGMFSYTNNWSSIHTKTDIGTDNTYTNTYMISECMVMEFGRNGGGTTGKTETFKRCVDGANWTEPRVGTEANLTESGIKRYLTLADMFNNVYYNEDGTVNETATKTENDWTKFDNKYWNVDTANKTISWR